MIKESLGTRRITLGSQNHKGRGHKTPRTPAPTTCETFNKKEPTSAPSALGGAREGRVGLLSLTTALSRRTPPTLSPRVTWTLRKVTRPPESLGAVLSDPLALSTALKTGDATNIKPATH